MIEIQKGGGFKFDSSLIDLSQINVEEFLLANLEMPISVESGTKSYDVIHFMYNIREFIYKAYSEHYETIRAFFVASKTKIKVDKIILTKEATIENGFFYLSPIVKFSHEDGGYKLCDSIMTIDEVIYVDETSLLVDETGVLSQINKVNLMSEFTLRDLITAIFYDLPSKIHHLIK